MTSDPRCSVPFANHIIRLCRDGRLYDALHFARLLDQNHSFISRDVFYHLLQACAKQKDQRVARQLHAYWISRSHLTTVTVLADHLIRLFTSLGRLEEAKEVFDDVPNPSVYTWNAVITAHIAFGEYEKALELLEQMQDRRIWPNEVTFLCGLRVCSSLNLIEIGRRLHYQITKLGFDVDVVVASTLIDMYAKCGNLEEGQNVFDILSNQNIVSWGALVTGYAMHGRAIKVLDIYSTMQGKGIQPSKVIYLGILKACAILGDEEKGRSIHFQISRHDLKSDLTIATALIDMYSKCGNLGEAFSVFSELLTHNVLSWGVMITAFTQHGHCDCALELFERMQREGVSPDKDVLCSILKASGSSLNKEHGRMLHGLVSKNGWALDTVVGSSLIDMYVKFTNLEEALWVFESLPSKNVVSWGALMMGYLEQEDGLNAILLFKKMLEDDIDPDVMIFVCVAKTCAMNEYLLLGKIVHHHIIYSGLESDVSITSALIDMYAKCSNMHEICSMFDGLQNPDIISWGSVIAAYASCGNLKMVNQGLAIMLNHGLQPDDVMFTTLLTTCGHAGLVEEGLHYFQYMRNIHCIVQNVEHYNCIIDMLSRNGRLHDAEALLATMPISPSNTGWISLLTSCKDYGDVELGNHCHDHATKLNPKDSYAHALMSRNIPD